MPTSGETRHERSGRPTSVKAAESGVLAVIKALEDIEAIDQVGDLASNLEVAVHECGLRTQRSRTDCRRGFFIGHEDHVWRRMWSNRGVVRGSDGYVVHEFADLVLQYEWEAIDARNGA